MRSLEREGKEGRRFRGNRQEAKGEGKRKEGLSLMVTLITSVITGHEKS